MALLPARKTLSGSYGNYIRVGAATSGTVIHTMPAHTGSTSRLVDEVWLYASNNSTGSMVLTVMFCSSSGIDSSFAYNQVKVVLEPRSGETKVLTGIPLMVSGSTNVMQVRAHAITKNVVAVHGFVDRMVFAV